MRTMTSHLILWAHAHGAVILSGIDFKTSGNGLGAFLYEPKNLIKIPLKCILLYDKTDLGIDGPRNLVLKLWLARERTSHSFFKPYLDLLPLLEQTNVPYVWCAKDKQYLKGTNLGSSLKDNLGHIVEEWWKVVNLLPEATEKPADHFVNLKFYYEFKFYTDDDLHKYLTTAKVSNWTHFANYLWASVMVKSRAFPAHLLQGSIARDIEKDEVMLLPVVDLLNHNPKAEVNWTVESDNGVFFSFTSGPTTGELFNNYGPKGNEELLLAYGFTLERNESDSSALKIKVPAELLPDLQAKGVKLPQISDYTFSVVSDETSESTKADDGLLFYINEHAIPENLLLLFQWLVRSPWENELTTRMKLAGLNQLRNAIDAKKSLLDKVPLPTESDTPHHQSITNYVTGQRRIFQAAIKNLKRTEKELLATHKGELLTLKSVYKKDVKFQQSLLVTLGASSFDDIVEHELQDQVWLLYLMRCNNRQHYIKTDGDEADNYLSEWIEKAFAKMKAHTTISAGEIVQYQQLYEGLIIPLNQTVPEIYNQGLWTVEDLIISAKLLDTISFVRGVESECILVRVDN